MRAGLLILLFVVGGEAEEVGEEEVEEIEDIGVVRGIEEGVGEAEEEEG